jgi:hypothetical protein
VQSAQGEVAIWVQVDVRAFRAGFPRIKWLFGVNGGAVVGRKSASSQGGGVGVGVGDGNP